MRTLRTVLANLLAIVIVLAMFSTASTRFETVVISALALIYFNIVSSVAIILRQSIEAAQGGLAQFISLGKRLGDPEMSDYEQLLEEATKEYARLTVQYRINSAFTFVIWLIVMWKLLAVTVFSSN